MKAFIFNLDSHTEASEEEGYGHAWESDDRSSSQWLDDSLTLAAGWSCTRTHTASMAAPFLYLANHLTHMVLDLGCTHATIEGVGLIASLESWHITPFIQPRSCNSTSPHMFRGGLTFHKSNGESTLTSCRCTCWVEFFHKSLQYPPNGIMIWNIQQRTPLVLCAATHFLHFHFQGQNRIAFLPCNESLQEPGNRNLHELIPGTNCLPCRHQWSLDVDIATTLEEKKRWDTEKNVHTIHVHVLCNHLHGWIGAWSCECRRYFHSILTLRIHGSSHKHHMEWSF